VVGPVELRPGGLLGGPGDGDPLVDPTGLLEHGDLRAELLGSVSVASDRRASSALSNSMPCLTSSCALGVSSFRRRSLFSYTLESSTQAILPGTPLKIATLPSSVAPM
jgi:hypothetical protein